MAKEQLKHKDILGQIVNEGNYVAISHHNSLYICQVTRLSSKMMRVSPIQRRGIEYLKYSDQSVLLSSPDALAYILIHSGS